MRRHSKNAASTTVNRSSSSLLAEAPVALPGKATGGEGGAAGGGGGGGSGWEDAGSTNPTTPVIEGGTQDAMLGGAPGGASVSSEPSPLLLLQQQQQPTQQQEHEQQEQQHLRQQQQHVNGTGQEGRSRIGSRVGSTHMTFSRRSSGVLLADVARRVSRSFSILSRGRRTSEQQNDGEGIGTKKASPTTAAAGSSGGGPGATVAQEAIADSKEKARCTSDQECSIQNGPTGDEATATHNTNGSGDADGTPPAAAEGGGAVKTRLRLLRSGGESSTRKGCPAEKGEGGKAAGVRTEEQSKQQLEMAEPGTVTTGGDQQAAGAAAGSGRESATGASQGIKGSGSNVAATTSSSSARTQSRNVFSTGHLSGVGQRSRRASSVAGGGSNCDKAAAGGPAQAQEPLVSSHSKRKFHIPHPHLPGHFRHKHQQELRRGASGSEPRSGHRQQHQHAGDGNSVSGEEGGPSSGAAAVPWIGTAAAGGGSAPAAPATAPHHQPHIPLLHFSSLLHHHKGSPPAAGAEQQTQQTQQPQHHHHLLPHLHLHHGGPAAAETSAAPDSGEDSMELLAQLHAAHERARDIVEKSRTQREQLLQRARAEVEEEAEVLRREAALTFEAKQEKREEQTEEACRAAAAGDDGVHVDPAALMRASQLCVAETLKVRVHLPEDFRKRLCLIHQHPPTFFRKSCASQYPSTRGLRDPGVLKAALHHAYCHGYQSNDKYYGDTSYMDEGVGSAYRGAGLDILGGGTGATSVSDANKEAYAAILGERGAWTEQDDEFRLDLREESPPDGGSGQSQSLLESVLTWFRQRSSSSSCDASSSSTSGALGGGRKEDERLHDRRAPVTCSCWPIVSTDLS